MILPPTLTEGRVLSRRPGAEVCTVDSLWKTHLKTETWFYLSRIGIYSFSIITFCTVAYGVIFLMGKNDASCTA